MQSMEWMQFDEMKAIYEMKAIGKAGFCLCTVMK